MKKYLTHLIFGLFLFSSIALFSQETEPIPEFPSFWKFVLGFAVATFSGVLADTVKHIFAGTFRFDYFWADSLRPLLLAFGLGLVVVAVQYFYPKASFLIEYVSGREIVLDYETIGLIGAALALFIKQLLKVPETKRKNLV